MLCRRIVSGIPRCTRYVRYLSDEKCPGHEESVVEEEYPSDKYQRSEEMIHRYLRVDHAGEVGANDIYAGQMAVLGRSDVAPVIQHMWDQEKEHRDKMNELIGEHRVRPTLLMPFWRAAGFALGAGTALMSKEAAMACTVAVEDTIVTHYTDQIREIIELGKEEEYADLLQILKKFRDDELEHHDTGLEHGAEEAVPYKALTGAIKVACKAAILITEKV